MTSPRRSLVTNSVDANEGKVRRHYAAYFNLLDRAKSFETAGWQRRPPIINLGYWTRGAKTAREAQEDFVHELVALSPFPRGSRILDVGCGVGGPATMLAQDYGALVEGVNIVDQQLTWARRFVVANGLNHQIRLHMASAMSLPFRDAVFDVVFCLEAAHCFADKPRFLREVLRVLRPGGKLLLADIVGNSGLPLVNWQPALGLNLVRDRDWLRMLASTGFRVERHQKIGRAVYPGCSRWVAQTAGERRRAIFEKSCAPGASPPIRTLLNWRASMLEVIFCRSILLTLARLGFREYIVLVASRVD